jgi:hypothetical protein
MDIEYLWDILAMPMFSQLFTHRYDKSKGSEKAEGG